MCVCINTYIHTHGDKTHGIIRYWISSSVVSTTSQYLYYLSFIIAGHLSVTPFLQPQIVSDDKNGVLLQWHRIYFSPYDREPTLQGYTVEVREQPSKEWKTLVKGLPTKNYLISNLKPREDYVFRVRGESETGELTEPSPSVYLFRSQGKWFFNLLIYFFLFY